MVKWLRTIISAVEANVRLEKEVEFWKTQCSLIAKQKEASDARFLREVSSNRKREDELGAMIRTLAKAPGRVPQRETEILTTENQPDITQTEFDFVGEAAIQNLVNQYVEQAAERGAIYTPEDREVLTARIRSNPDEYFAN